MTSIGPGSRTTIKRGDNRADNREESILGVLDAGFLCQVGYTLNGQAKIIPTAYVRIEDAVYLHGHLKNEMMNALLDGQTACISVTLLDGLVLARSGFHHSVNYRSVTLFGKAEKIEGVEKQPILDKLVNHIVPDSVPSLRPHSRQELNATLVLKIPIEEAAAKIRNGPPVDAEKDYDSDIWAGVVEVNTTYGEIENCPRLGDGIETPQHVLDLVARRDLFK